MMDNFDSLFLMVSDGFFAAIAAIGFSVVCNPPRRAILFTAILAAIGHMIRYVLMTFLAVDITTASFFGAFGIGWFCILAAMHLHCTTTTLYIPALLPMIPGMFAYRTVFALTRFLQNMNNDAIATQYMLDVFRNGLTTIAVVFVLAVGAMLPTFILREKAFGMTRGRK